MINDFQIVSKEKELIRTIFVAYPISLLLIIFTFLDRDSILLFWDL